MLCRWWILKLNLLETPRPKKFDARSLSWDVQRWGGFHSVNSMEHQGKHQTYHIHSDTLYIPWLQNASSAKVGVFQNVFCTYNFFWCAHLESEEVCNNNSSLRFLCNATTFSLSTSHLFCIFCVRLSEVRQVDWCSAWAVCSVPFILASCWTPRDKFQGRAGGRLAEAKEPFQRIRFFWW